MEKSQRKRKGRIFYGWYIVLASFIAHIPFAEQNSPMLGLFVRPINKEFGWSRTEITGVQTMTRLVEGLCAPILGPFVDRYGPRPLMLIGGTIAGFALLGLSQIRNIWEYYLMRGYATGIGFLFLGYMTTAVAISNWFVRLRGRAFGIAGMGTQVGNIGMAPIAAWMITRWSWRAVWMAFGFFTWVTVLIPALWMRRRPEDMGLYPDGDDPSGAPTSDSVDPQKSALVEEEPLEPVWSRREVLATGAFWLIIITFSVSQLAFQGINISMAPLFEDLGFGTTIAALALSTRSIFSLIGAPIWGLAAERIDVRYLGCLKFGLQGLASLLFLVGRSLPVLFAGIFVYGIGSSGSEVISGIIWAVYYGRLTLGTVRGIGAPLLTAFSAVGPIFMSAVFDITGSYQLAFILFIFMFALSAILILFLKPPTAKRFARASEFETAQGRQTSEQVSVG